MATKVLISALLVLGTAIRAAMLSLPMAKLSSLFLIDDSFITFDIARSIARGHGPAAAGRLTNGFQPLWALLASLPYRILGDATLTDLRPSDSAVRLVLVLGVLCDLALIGAILLALARRFGVRSPALVLAASYWALSPRACGNALNGMETVLVLALFHVAWGWLDELSKSAGLTKWQGVITGAMLAMLLLSRVDQAIAVGLFVLLCGSRFRNRGFALSAASAFLLPILLWSVWIQRWTGHVYPVSGEASRLQSIPSPEFLPRVAFHLRVFWLNVMGPSRWLLLIALVLTVMAIAFRGFEETARAGRTLVFHAGTCLATAAAYIIYQGGCWYFPRYLALFDWTVLLWAAIAVNLLVGEDALRRRVAGFGAVALCMLMMFSHPILERLTAVEVAAAQPKGYRAVAVWARKSFAPGSVVGAVQSGALGYYATTLKVVNLDGVVNVDALQAIRARRLIAYALGEGVQFVLGPYSNLKFVMDQESDPALVRRMRIVGVGPTDGFVNAPWLVSVLFRF